MISSDRPSSSNGDASPAAIHPADEGSSHRRSGRRLRRLRQRRPPLPSFVAFSLTAAIVVVVLVDASSSTSFPPPSSSSFHRRDIDGRHRRGGKRNDDDGDNDSRRRIESIRRLLSMIPPPHPSSIGGEIIDDDAYARYLSVSNWDPNIAAPKLECTLRWMGKVRPGTIRPRHCPVLCRQGAWIALTTTNDDGGRGGGVVVGVGEHRGEGWTRDGGNDVLGAPPPSDDDDGSHEYVRGICALGGHLGTSTNERGRRAWRPRRGRTSRRNDDDRDEDDDGYDQPYDCPRSYRWRTTAHGLPVTHFRCWNWRPDLAGDENEMDLHAAYTMNHLIRRASYSRQGGGRGWGGENGEAVARVCIVFDLRGFETWMLPYVHRCVNLLRMHYPGRAGAFVFINSPVVFRGVWGMISPWLDDELRSKVHFAPTDVRDVDAGIVYVNRMKLRVGPV